MRLFQLAMLSVLVGGWGCTTAGNVSNSQCTSTQDCSDGFLCRDFECVALCSSDSQCGPTEVCDDGVCQPVAIPACQSDADCVTTVDCLEAAGQCIGGDCRYVSKDSGDACDDGSLCTTNDHCDGEGECVGDAVVCDMPPVPECVASDQTYRVYLGGECNESDGLCDYMPLDTPCTDCAANCLGLCDGVDCLSMPCRDNGRCDPFVDPPACVYDDEADGAVCLDPANKVGVCNATSCVECVEDPDCLIPQGAIAECVSRTCSNMECEVTILQGGECAPQYCEGFTFFPARTCNPSGQCPATAGSPCASGLVCRADGTECRKSCTRDRDCQQGLSCVLMVGGDAGKCTELGVPPRP